MIFNHGFFLYKKEELYSEINCGFDVPTIYESKKDQIEFLTADHIETPKNEFNKQVKSVLDFKPALFASLSEDPSMKTVILDLLRQDQTEIITAYSKMVNTAEGIVTELLTNWEDVLNQKGISKENLFVNLLSRAKELLHFANEKLQKGEGVYNLIKELKQDEKSKLQLLDNFKELRDELKKTEIDLYSDLDLMHAYYCEFDEDMEANNKILLQQEYNNSNHKLILSEIKKQIEYHRKAFQEDKSIKIDQLPSILNHTEMLPKFLQLIKTNENKLEKLEKSYEKYQKFSNILDERISNLLLQENNILIPENIIEDILSPLETETINNPKNKPIYFPVGITKEMDKFEKVQNGELIMTKPVDIYSYLFWLDSQAKDENPVSLYVADEVQENNYKLFYPDILKDKEDIYAKNVAIEFGKRDKEFYQKVIDTFGLKIEIRPFNKIKETNKYQYYYNLCTKLKDTKLFKQAFLKLIPDSIKKYSESYNELIYKLIEYSITEIAFILSLNGLKVTHSNEAHIGYDPIVCVIKNIENEAINRGQTFDQTILDNQLFTKILSKIDIEISNRINSSSKGIQKEYWNEFKLFLFGKTEGKGSNKKEIIKPAFEKTKNVETKKMDFEIDFHCPKSANSQSYGINNAGGEIVSFKECYSTYFLNPNNPIDNILNIDQIPISSNKGFYQSLLVKLNPKKQQEYLTKTLQPLLKHFFHYLKTNPNNELLHDMFVTEEILRNEFTQCSTIIDVLDFIQKYIILPSLIKFPSK